jgi:hypothetical protein
MGGWLPTDRNALNHWLRTTLEEAEGKKPASIRWSKNFSK